MIELDYAYLADFATVQDGKINTIGASFTFVTPAILPSNLSMSIAGRLRVSEDVREAMIQVEITAPNAEYEIKADVGLHAREPLHPYNGKLGMLFAINVNLPLVAAGLYVVNVLHEGTVLRRLAFEARAPQE